ncbi:unnamed protein product [Schistocephalus solidus]|uniref:Reverse transcriptase domain-containing protein n=1 Tax=Schistocephalus solidus TaxID=70667 RepID=A0A183TJI1_SCHSO|nr:unnamed protein product [Schistocephalus solidus]
MDHRPIISKMKLRLQHRRKPKITEKLEDLHAPDNKDTMQRGWCQLRNVIQSTSLEDLGRARHQHQDWYDDNDADISNLLAEKNGLRKAYMDIRTDATKSVFFRFRHLRWAEHFRRVLNCSSAISDAAIDRLTQVDTNHDLDLPPFLPETILAVQQTSSEKAPGSDAIPSEVYKHGGPWLMVELTTLFQKSQEIRTHLYTTFVDLTKAFDTVNRDGLWKVMQKFGCPERFTHMGRQLHDGMTARVTDNGTVSEAFAVTNGVKQGCVLAPTLFSLMFSAMLMDAYRDEHPGFASLTELMDTFSTVGVCKPQRTCLRLQSMTCSSRATEPLTL